MDDAPTIKKYLSKIDTSNKFYIDIGASFSSNLTDRRVIKSDLTIFCECDESKYPTWNKWGELKSFNLVTEKISPNNIIGLFEKITDKKDPCFLDIDIDGYDFYVLEALLKGGYRPSLICAETNEKIPPPIKFSVKYDPAYSWDVSHFYGMSIAKADELFQEYGYDIIDLTYNNVYAVLRDKNTEYKTYSAAEAYDKFYRNRADRAAKYPWNNNVSSALEMSPEDGVKFFNNFFAGREFDYELYI